MEEKKGEKKLNGIPPLPPTHFKGKEVVPLPAEERREGKGRERRGRLVSL